MSGDTGYKMLQKSSQFNFLKWGHYMKRANIAERKVEKLKALLLLTDEAVGHVEMNELTTIQWLEYARCFPEDSGN